MITEMSMKKGDEEEEIKKQVQFIEKSFLHPELSSVEYDKEHKKFLLSSVIPTVDFFKEKLNMIEYRLDESNEKYRDLKLDMANQFKQVDKRFEQVDKRFDSMQIDMDKRFDSMQIDMDKRFEQVDKRFDSMQIDIKDLTNKFDKLYHLLENRDRDQRGFTIRMFMISISVSVLGVLGILLKTMGVVD